MDRRATRPVPFALSLPLVVACSSSTFVGADSGASGGDTGDASVTTNDASTSSSDDGASGSIDAPSDSPRATACTAPPFFAFTGHVREITAGALDLPLAAASIGFTSCAGFTLTTDVTGVAATQVTQGIAYSTLFSAPGHVSSIGAESPATSDVDVTVKLVAQSASTIVPGYDAAKPSLHIVLDAKGTAPCNSVDGVTIAVTNHPEGTPKYMSANWPTDRNPTARTTSLGSDVFVTGLAGGITVQVTGAKPNCQVTTVTPAQTGKFQLVNGLVTVGSAIITN